MHWDSRGSIRLELIVKLDMSALCCTFDALDRNRRAQHDCRLSQGEIFTKRASLKSSSKDLQQTYSFESVSCVWSFAS